MNTQDRFGPSSCEAEQWTDWPRRKTRDRMGTWPTTMVLTSTGPPWLLSSKGIQWRPLAHQERKHQHLYSFWVYMSNRYIYCIYQYQSDIIESYLSTFDVQLYRRHPPSQGIMAPNQAALLRASSAWAASSPINRPPRRTENAGPSGPWEFAFCTCGPSNCSFKPCLVRFILRIVGSKVHGVGSFWVAGQIFNQLQILKEWVFEVLRHLQGPKPWSCRSRKTTVWTSRWLLMRYISLN